MADNEHHDKSPSGIKRHESQPAGPRVQGAAGFLATARPLATLYMPGTALVLYIFLETLPLFLSGGAAAAARGAAAG
jgi:hypothetical protein